MTINPDLKNKADKFFGKEKSEEVFADLDFLSEEFLDVAIAFALVVAENYNRANDEVEKLSYILSIFHSGILIYREWLVGQGVDILALEGRK